MNHRDYVAEREERDPRFRAAREALRPEYEYRRASIAARLAAGLTQQKLAARLGTTQSAIARLESGSHMPRLDTLHQPASVLGVDFTITRSGAWALAWPSRDVNPRDWHRRHEALHRLAVGARGLGIVPRRMCRGLLDTSERTKVGSWTSSW